MLSSPNPSPICNGAEKNGIKVVQTQHEVTAVSAADANSRVTGLPGVAVVSCAPGLNNTLAAVKAAMESESAVVLIGTASSTILKSSSIEVTDAIKTLKPLVKWTGKVDRVRDIAYELREGLRQALHGTPGPVYIEFTLDCLHAFPVVKKEFDKITTKTRYTEYYMKNLFAAGFDVGREIRPWPIEIPFPKKEMVSKTVKDLTKAERPLIVFGSQATLPPIEETKVATILTDMGIPCFFTGLSRGILPSTHVLYMKHGLKEALRGSDCILLLGLNESFKTESTVKSKVSVHVVNRNKATLKANAKQLGSHATQIHSDVGQFLVEVSEKLGRFAISEQWLRTLKEMSHESEKQLKEASSSWETVIADLVGDKKTIVVTRQEDKTSLLQSKGPWLESSSCNTSLLAGYALGAKLARRDHLTLSLLSPQDLNVSEVATYCEAGAANLVVVSGSGVKTEDLKDFAQKGGQTVSVKSSDSLCNLKPNISKAFNSLSEGYPVLLNVQS